MVDDDDEISRRLEDTPEELDALRAGQLDVVLPLPGESDRLYTRTSSERIYRLIIEQMREGAVLVPHGVDTIVYCNQSFIGLLGSPSEHVVGGSMIQWLEPVDGSSIEALVHDTEDLRADYHLRNTQGASLPISISATSVRELDTLLRCLIINDLRVRRDVERLQQVRAELEQSHQRKNEFLAMLGHELRNPLAPVRQAVELLEAHATPGDAEYLVKSRTVLSRQITHIKRLVDDLLDVGRVTKGTLAIECSPIDLREAILAAKESVERLIERRAHQIRLELPSTPMRVHGDMVRLTQVFANLISNAAKYTPDRGHLNIEVSSEPPNYRICVRDDGRGIEPELIPYLFEPFVQSEATLDRSAGGIGVGLTLVRRIVELHEGSVAARSEGPGRGSEFRVWLPALEVWPEPGDESELIQTEAIATPAARHILVVDDNEDAAEMLALVLRKRGYEVELAFDGEQALTLIEDQTFEVVLLDIGLPGVDGYEVARRLRARASTLRPTLIALTGYGLPEDRSRALAAGFDHHLTKPVGIDEVVALLRPIG